MKLKYYLRGLGIGILVTAIILIIAHNLDTLTVSELEKEAKKRGYSLVAMEEETLFPDNSSSSESDSQTDNEPADATTEDSTGVTTEEPTDATTEEPTDATTEVPTETSTEKPTEAPTEKTTEAPTEAPTEKQTEAPTEKQTEAPTEKQTEAPTQNTQPATEPAVIRTVTLTITPGMSSETVSKALYDLGVIANWQDFDNYLCNNGFDLRISTGTYAITTDMSYADIANIITP